MSAKSRIGLIGGTLLVLALAVGGCCTMGVRCSPKDMFNVIGATRLNSCDEGDHAVVVRVYSLRASEAFTEAAFDRLWDDRGRALGEDVAAVKEFTVMPGEPAQEYKQARGKGVTAIGVVADFCEHKSGCWKKVFPLDKGSTRVRVRLEKLCLTVDKM